MHNPNSPFSNSPYKPGTAEDFTCRLVEQQQARDAEDPNNGAAMMAFTTGLGRLLTGSFWLSGRLLRSSFGGAWRLLAGAPLLRAMVVGAVLASAFGLLLSTLMHDEIMRAQLRLVPVGAGLGLLVGGTMALLRRGRARRA